MSTVTLEMPPIPAYTSEQFLSDLAQASVAGDAAAASIARAKARSSSIGFNRMTDRPTIDGVTYQSAMRNAWFT